MMELIEGLAIVTGADAGLGRAMAIELVRRGMRVAGFGHTDGLAETAQLAGSGFQPCSVDVGSPEEVNAVVDRLALDIAPVTLLINNAAVLVRRDFLDETPQSFMRSVAINLGGVVNCSHAALRHMVQTGKGRILNVSPFADMSSTPASSAYVVSSGAARNFTKALRLDIEDRFPDIVINDWAPGIGASETVESAARWGVELALWNEATLRGTIWERDSELLPLRSLKVRIKDALRRRTRKARFLGGV